VKPLAGLDELVLYLDYDGVLHHENVHWHPRRGAILKAPERYRLFQHATLLEDVLRPFPTVRIVLSTSWVRYYGFSKAANRLTPGLRARVIGATYHSQMPGDSFAELPRGLQVWGDVRRRRPRDWLALDDNYLGWPATCLDKYIRTHDYEGISDPEVLAELKVKLQALCK
jgi:HAD domain in Swiss Army Knife RNA repair proteins